MTEPPLHRTLAPQRHEAILRRLEADGAVFVTEIARQFDVSQETVRRDLKALAARGMLELTHGGATRFSTAEPALMVRAVRNAAGKQRIAARAAAMVADGMVVLLDGGTTTAAVARALKARRGLTVITPSLPIALDLCRCDGIRVQIAGGTVNPGDEVAEGPELLAALDRFRVDIAFVSAGGVAPDGGVTDFTLMGAEARARMIAAAQRGWFVIDSSKFGLLTPCRIGGPARAAGIITDRAPEARIAAALARSGREIILP